MPTGGPLSGIRIAIVAAAFSLAAGLTAPALISLG